MKIKNDNKFKVFKNSKALQMLLNKARLDFESLVIWRFGGGRKLTAEIKLKVIRKHRDELVFSPLNSQIKELEELLAGCEYVNIFMPNDGVLFQSRLLGYDEDKTLTITRPSEYVQIDRRAHLRLNVSEKSDIKVVLPQKKSFFRKELHKSLYDISAGGFSVLCSKNELREVFVDLRIKDVQFIFNGKPYNVDTKIVYHKELDPNVNTDIIYKCWKVSFQFLKIDLKLKEAINSYVFNHLEKEELAVYWSKVNYSI